MSPHHRAIFLSVLLLVGMLVGIFLAIRKIYGAHHTREGELHVFRYSPIVAWAYIAGPLSLGVVAYVTAYGLTLSPAVESRTAVAISVLSVGLLSLVGIWYRSFSITVDPNGVLTRSIFRQTAANFSELRRIVVTGYPARTLVVVDNSGKRVLSAYDDLQDFGELVYLLKLKSAKYHVEAKIRDQWGKWSDI